jgi:hypothetical protein
VQVAHQSVTINIAGAQNQIEQRIRLSFANKSGEEERDVKSIAIKPALTSITVGVSEKVRP